MRIKMINKEFTFEIIIKGFYFNDELGISICEEELHKYFDFPYINEITLVLSHYKSKDAYFVYYDNYLNKYFEKPIVVKGKKNYRPRFPIPIDNFIKNNGPFYVSLEYYDLNLLEILLHDNYET
jgi:hypothetical protein